MKLRFLFTISNLPFQVSFPGVKTRYSTTDESKDHPNYFKSQNSFQCNLISRFAINKARKILKNNILGCKTSIYHTLKFKNEFFATKKISFCIKFQQKIRRSRHNKEQRTNLERIDFDLQFSCIPT